MCLLMKVYLKNGRSIFDNEHILIDIFKDLEVFVILNMVIICSDDSTKSKEIMKSVIAELDKLKFDNNEL